MSPSYPGSSPPVEERWKEDKPPQEPDPLDERRKAIKMPEKGLGWDAVEELYQLKRRRARVGQERDMAGIFLVLFLVTLVYLIGLGLAEDWDLNVLQTLAVALGVPAGLCGLTLLGVMSGGQLFHPAVTAGESGKWRIPSSDNFLLLPFSGKHIRTCLNSLFLGLAARFGLGFYTALALVEIIVHPPAGFSSLVSLVFPLAMLMVYAIVWWPFRKVYRGFGYREVGR